MCGDDSIESMVFRINIKKNLGYYFRGIAMGMADVVPGVSGGTVAFITGIYAQLLQSIRNISVGSLPLLLKKDFQGLWQHISGNFLLTLALGIITGVLLLANVLHQILQQTPHLLWSFFFGLIAASSVFMIVQLQRRSWKEVVAGLCGVIMAAGLALQTPIAVEPSLLVVFAAGAVAICAMILPGISGSFILLLLGLYEYIIISIKTFDLFPLSVFVSGCIIGLLSFSHLVHFLLERYKTVTLAVLIGFMVGALVKVWPWKATISTRINSHGIEVPVQQVNVWPTEFVRLMQSDSDWFFCLSLMFVGMAVVFILEKWAQSVH